MQASRLLPLLAVVAVRVVPRRLVEGGPTMCVFRRATGMPCPSCGMTRSWSAATRLDVRRSLAWHPLGIPTLIGVLLVSTGVVRPSLDDARWRHWTAIGGTVWLGVWLRRLVRPPRGLVD
jgi:Protein of unknown function (DUF2752)